ncbi:MAG: NAD(P)-dependent alcohol dehydrogenase [Nocardiaceae bacterium]|nr:NAD(P)-dependent alcohol dehydrogenase [Nocardiaceae bacterium]
MNAVAARGMTASDSDFEKLTIDRRDPAGRDVVIEVKFVGICHSDIHTARNEWPGTVYPCVPGHEIAGIVSAIGPEVTKYQVGDRVGVGCLVNSCGKCEPCVAGEEQFCKKAVWTYNSRDVDGTITYGGYSQQIVVNEGFVLRIPDALELDVAAPLLCAGVTLYSPLRHWDAGPGKRIAIVGMGGLGHVGVQIAAAMGAEVSVLSQTLSKQEDGLKLGASAYYATSDSATFGALRGKFDLILNTVSADLNIDRYLSLLRLDGSLVMLGLPTKPLSIRTGMLTSQRRSLSGSSIGGIRETQEMLDFCAEHKIAPLIELITGDDITGAYDRVLRSDVRYRFVVDAGTI